METSENTGTAGGITVVAMVATADGDTAVTDVVTEVMVVDTAAAGEDATLAIQLGPPLAIQTTTPAIPAGIRTTTTAIPTVIHMVTAATPPTTAPVTPTTPLAHTQLVAIQLVTLHTAAILPATGRLDAARTIQPPAIPQVIIPHVIMATLSTRVTGLRMSVPTRRAITAIRSDRNLLNQNAL